jgi:hypothetical protein
LGIGISDLKNGRREAFEARMNREDGRKGDSEGERRKAKGEGRK